MRTNDYNSAHRTLTTNVLGENDLAMPRAKPRSLPISIAYRLKRAGQLVASKQLLMLCLNGAWLLKRFAFELSGDRFGPAFQQAALGLSEELLCSYIPENGSVIDIGCGSGRWCRVAARSARTVVGIDRDSGRIRDARALSPNSNIEYIVGDITSELIERKFDVALLIHVIEHIDDPDWMLRTIAQFSHTLVIEVPDFEADPLNLVRYQLGCPYYSDADHVREYTLSMLRGQLERNGWRVQHQDRCGGAVVAVAVKVADSDTDTSTLLSVETDGITQ